jgi:glycosyltransferase involved in cell wall biosynthesis
MMEKTRVALVMIARNEARCIARCLRSIAPFVDDMIVLDTGSDDDTVAIAQALGARVHHFQWIDDFAAARNAALDLSNADWNLVLDADEWLDGSAAALAPAALGNAPFIGVIPVANNFDLQGKVEVAVSWISRLLPRGVRYEGRIHDQPVSSLPRRNVSLPIQHDGYRQDSLAAKDGRNEALLLRALAESPGDAYLLYQLGKNYEIYAQYGAAVDYYSQAMASSSPDSPFRHDLVMRTLFSMKKANLHEQAIALAESEMPNWQHSPDFFFVLGDLMLDWATLNPAIAFEELLPIAESSWLTCLHLGDQPKLAGSVTGRGSHLAAHNLAVLYDGMGEPDKADFYRKLAKQR